ncbi:inositol monophosphatase [Streptococcus pneumoniae]|nr:inositol monophosphatase [Streptococcus pneumoniae]CWA59063.1 inositol monophosphatase [Streptococcus pneumoniae]
MESKFEFAKELVKKAGQYILDHMQEDLRVETKSSPTDLVTRLDKEVQELLVGEILSRYPEDKICAEEGCLRASVQ